jgi:hypothetical protein
MRAADLPLPPEFETVTLEQLTIEDEASFKHVALYHELKGVLRRAGYTFRVLPKSQAGRWDRALCLNLTFWGADGGGDVLVARTIPADVVAHVAWHHLAAHALPTPPGARPSAEAMLFGESIASAFDVYLVGRLLGHAPTSTFLETQVPAMADAAAEAGANDEQFEALLSKIAADPEAAFDELRGLLFHVAAGLLRCPDATQALGVLDASDASPFAMLLHRFELSNWVLHTRAYGSHDALPDVRRLSLEREIAANGGGLTGLTRTWLGG